MQYGVNPFKEEGCTTCKHYKHKSADCMVDYKKHGRIYPMEPGLSPCRQWVKGFVLLENSWGVFVPIEGGK